MNGTNFNRAVVALAEVIVDPRWTVEEADEVAANIRQSKSELHLQFVRRKIGDTKQNTVVSGKTFIP